jgi:general secretion pathway protein C
MKRWPVVASFVLFSALCASTAYWVMQFFKPPVRAVAAPTQIAQPEFNLDAAAGLFGGRRTAALAAASNYVLKGVVVAGNPRLSVAIVAVDGKPTQAIGIDAEVVRGVTVKEVHTQYVLLSEAGVAKRVPLQENVKTPATASTPNVAPVPIQAQAPVQAPPQIPSAVIRDQPAPTRGARSRRNNSDSD